MAPRSLQGTHTHPSIDHQHNKSNLGACVDRVAGILLQSTAQDVKLRIRHQTEQSFIRQHFCDTLPDSEEYQANQENDGRSNCNLPGKHGMWHCIGCAYLHITSQPY